MFSINAPHWHLLLNHLPVAGVIFAVPMLIYAFIRNNSELKRTALIFFVLIGIVTFLSNLTGGPAAKAVSGLPGIVKADIRAHSQSADISLIASELLAVLSLITLIVAWRRKDKTVVRTIDDQIKHYMEPPIVLTVLCLLIGIADIGLLSWTSNLGGAIRHPEIRTDSLTRALPVAPAISAPTGTLPAPAKH